MADSFETAGTRVAPPRLHWGWVLVLSVCTGAFFGMLWLVVQAMWTRQVRGRGVAFPVAVVHCASLPTLTILLMATGVSDHPDQMKHILSVFRFVTLFLYLATIFILREELTSAPVELSLSGLWSVVLGPVYFQFHMQKFNFGEKALQTLNRTLDRTLPWR